MGLQADGLVHAVTRIAKAFDPLFEASTVELRPSKGGKYLGITITVTATSREQLDELYRTLSTPPDGQSGSIGTSRANCPIGPG